MIQIRRKILKGSHPLGRMQVAGMPRLGRKNEVGEQEPLRQLPLCSGRLKGSPPPQTQQKQAFGK